MSSPFKIVVLASEYSDGSHPVGVSTLSYKYESSAETAYFQLCEKPYLKVYRAYVPGGQYKETPA